MARQQNLGQIIPNIQVGTTETVEPSQNAEVINVGTSLNPILNFKIPKGEQGTGGTNDYNDLINKPDLSQYITKSVDDLINYYKKSETYTQAEINALIGAISTINLLVVQTLPTQDISTTTIYLVPKTTSSTNNVYDEYIYVSNAWEKIGSTEVDLSNYYTKSQTDDLLDNKQDTLTFDNTPTQNSNNPVKSGGIYTYINNTLGDINTILESLVSVGGGD